MDDDKKSSGGFMPSQGLLWVAAIAAGAFFIREAPLQGSRPAATDPKPYSYLAPQDIDARLWQDPLTAISRGREDIRKRYARTAEAEQAPPRTGTPRAGVPAAPRRAPVPAATEQTDHDPSRLAHDIDQRTDRSTAGRPRPPLVLGVMVQGGSYAESIESRRRARYAVLAGLQEMGYAPDDAAHIGYLLPTVDLKVQDGLPEFIAYEWFVGKDGGTPVLVLWLDEYIFANETVARIHALRDALRPPASGGPASVDTDAQFAVVGPGYSSTLHDMAKRVTENAPDDGLAFYAYGASVDQQRILAGTPLQAKDALYRHDQRRDWESPQRRADPYLEDLNLLRTTGDDASLAVTLRGELGRRGIEPGCNAVGHDRKQHIILIAESDTLRGRSLPTLVEAQFLSPSPPAAGAVAVDGEPTGAARGSDGRALDCPGREKQRIHRYSYLRGLDGQLPAREDTADPDAKKSDAQADPSRGGSRTEVQRQIERPEGQAQVDYLRRLSVQLADLDRRWRSRGESIQAIGVLGSDVFDKLLILQALRPQFRGAIFFTTDLDARLLHPQEQDWARNLVVASSFGLTLRPELQHDIPPFRDGLETSIYLTTLIALHNAKQECGLFNPGCDTRIDADDLFRWVQQPRIFEIGRIEAFDFSESSDAQREKRECGLFAPGCGSWIDVGDITRWGGPPRRRIDAVDPDPSSDAPDAPCAGASSLKACSDIQPPGTALFLSPGGSKFYAGIVFFALIAFIVAVATGLVARILLRWRTGAKASDIGMLQWVGRSSVDVYACAAAAVVALVVLALPLGLWQTIADNLTEHGLGEPMSLTAGVSIWPGEMVRVAAIVLSAFFIYESWWQLDANLRLISQKLAFEPTYEAMRTRVKQDYATWTRTQRFFRAISFLLIEYAGGPPQAKVDLTWSAQLFWKKYLYQGRFWARVARVMLAGTAYFVVSAILIFAFGVPNTPYRGHVAQVVDRGILGLSLLITLFVIFFVVDATVFCCQVIKALRDDVLGDGPDRHVPASTRWANSTLQHYTSRFRIHPRYIDAWILIDFIALRTEAISKLVYFPFIVIALMALSRDRAFDNWTMPLGLLMVFAINVTIVAVCAVLLRRSAEKTRERVLELLSDDLIRLKSRRDANVDQLEAMVVRVRGIAVGAFAPYSQQPIVRAVLALLTALGGPALLDYLNLTGI